MFGYALIASVLPNARSTQRPPRRMLVWGNLGLSGSTATNIDPWRHRLRQRFRCVPYVPGCQHFETYSGHFTEVQPTGPIPGRPAARTVPEVSGSR